MDGAWSIINESKFGGGIGGTIHNNQRSILLSFSGPVHANSALYTEFEGISFVFKCIALRNFRDKRVVICSDSVSAVNAFNKSLHIDFPILVEKFQYHHLINSSVFIHFVPRVLNQNADSLAKKAFSGLSCQPTGLVWPLIYNF